MSLGFLITFSLFSWLIIWFHLVVLPYLELPLSWVVLLANLLKFSFFKKFHHDRNQLLLLIPLIPLGGVLFQVFLDSLNMKRFSSTSLFELIKVNENMSTQYKFNPFPDWNRLFTKYEYLSRTWLRGSLEYFFYLFRLKRLFTKRNL